jgi:hypothetical protein
MGSPFSILIGAVVCSLKKPASAIIANNNSTSGTTASLANELQGLA